MDHVGIVKNVFRTTLRYRGLLDLGILWALVGGGGSGFSSGLNYTMNSETPPDGFPMPYFDYFDPGMIFAVIVALCCLALIVGIIIAIVRYVLQAGVYRSLARWKPMA